MPEINKEGTNRAAVSDDQAAQVTGGDGSEQESQTDVCPNCQGTHDELCFDMYSGITEVDGQLYTWEKNQNMILELKRSL